MKITNFNKIYAFAQKNSSHYTEGKIFFENRGVLLKVITKILQAVSFLLSLFLLWAGLASLIDVCNSARLMGRSSFIPSIVAGLVFIVMLICEAWLSLRINKLDDRGIFFFLDALLLLTAGEMVAPVALGSGFLWLNLLQLLLILLARFAIDFHE